MRNLLSWADQLIFIFPTWWSGMPGYFKGLLIRVLLRVLLIQNGPRGPVGETRWKSVDHYDHNTPKEFSSSFSKTTQRF